MVSQTKSHQNKILILIPACQQTLNETDILEEKEDMNRCSEKFHAQFTEDTKVLIS